MSFKDMRMSHNDYQISDNYCPCNRTLRVGLAIGSNDTINDGNIRGFSIGGYSEEIMQLAAEVMKCDFEGVIPKFGTFGTYVNGHWDGVIGDIIADNIDVSVPDFWPVADRLEAVDAVDTYIASSRLCVVLNKRHLAETSAVLWWRVLSPSIWGLLVGCLLFIYSLNKRLLSTTRLHLLMSTAFISIIFRKALYAHFVTDVKFPFDSIKGAGIKMGTEGFMLATNHPTGYYKNVYGKYLDLGDFYKEITNGKITVVANALEIRELILENKNYFYLGSCMKCNHIAHMQTDIAKKELSENFPFFFTTSLIAKGGTKLKRKIETVLLLLTEAGFVQRTLIKYRVKLLFTYRSESRIIGKQWKVVDTLSVYRVLAQILFIGIGSIVIESFIHTAKRVIDNEPSRIIVRIPVL